MEKIKLTKEEFIKRSINGERFNYFSNIFYYDEKEDNPFRMDNNSIDNNWYLFDGTREFLVYEPVPKTEIVKEWMYSDDGLIWTLYDKLVTEEQAKTTFEFYKSQYKPTGREWVVDV